MSDNNYIPDLEIRNARLGTGKGKNFSGQKRMNDGIVVNAEGNRTFILMLDDPELVEQMKADGWNIRYTRPRKEGDEPAPYISVDANFGRIPPEIWKKTPNSKPIRLEEEDVKDLDNDNIIEAHAVVHPRPYNINGRTGVKAYLRRLLVTVEDDPFEDWFSKE